MIPRTLRATTGTVYLVGAGPGAPDLLTLRAARLLARADVVLHDALVNPEILALAPRAQRIAVGKRCAAPSMPQNEIDGLLVACARTREVVVRLKGGDPMLFGRADEEMAALRAAGIPFEVVPGITAALGAAAAVGIPLTRRGDVRSVVLSTPRRANARDAIPHDGATKPGANDPAGSARGDRAAASAPGAGPSPLPAATAGAIYMGAHELASLAASLRMSGMPDATPVVVVEHATLPTQRTRFATLATLAAIDDVEAPAIVLYGPQFAEPGVAHASVVACAPATRAAHRTTARTGADLEGALALS